MENEKRLIDANACPALFDEKYKETMQLINQGETHIDNLAEGFTEAHRVIQEMPTVDAVEVVRCKDCIWYEKGKCYEQYCNHPSHGIPYPDDNDFCSYGERKDNG